MHLRRDIADIWRRQIVATGKRERFLVLASFLVTFSLVRLITYAIKYNWVPGLRNIQTASGLHIHHLVFGIVILLWVGYVAIEFDEHSIRAYLAVSYGIGAALTLDEFALWLNLQDVYWAKQGRESIDAVVIVAVTLTLFWLGLGFWRGIGRLLLRVARTTLRLA